MHHKRKRPKNRRAGCLLCKPNKMNGWGKRALGHSGFGKLRSEAAADSDLATANDVADGLLKRHDRADKRRMVPEKPRTAADVFRPFWGDAEIDLRAPPDMPPEPVAGMGLKARRWV